MARHVFFDKEQLKAEKKSRDAAVHAYNCSLASRQVFLSELHPDTNEESLRQYFSSLGVVVVEAFVRRYMKTDVSQCIGYATFMSEPEVAFVLATDHEIDGKRISIEQYQVGFLPVRSMPHSLLVKFHDGNAITPLEVQRHFSELCGDDRVRATIDRKDPNQCKFKVKFSGRPSKETCVDRALSHGPIQSIGSKNFAVTRSTFFTEERAENEKRGWLDEGTEEYTARLCPRQVFVSELSLQSTEESIREYFTDEFGIIVVEVINIRYKGTGLSQRSCLVTFLDENAVRTVTEHGENGRRPQHIIDGQRAHVMPSRVNSTPLRVLPYTLSVSFSEDEPLTTKQLEHYFQRQSGDNAVSVQLCEEKPGNAIVRLSGAPGKETCIDGVLAIGSAQTIDSVTAKVGRLVFYVTSKNRQGDRRVKVALPKHNGQEVVAHVPSRHAKIEGRLANPFYGK